MSLQFIFGGSGSGKTRFLYDHLIDMSLKNPDGNFIAIVPEQFTMQTQKEIVSLHPRHGTMNIDIVSFQRLAYRVFEELAVENLEVLDDMGKSMILRKVAADKKKKLNVFHGHLNQAGFISQLKSMLSEFYQYGASVEMLTQMIQESKSPMLQEKLKDLSVIYQGFQDYIANRFITAEEILDVLCRVLPQSKMIRDSIITLDGYTGFTPVQYRLLEILLSLCKTVTVTVTIDPSRNPYQLVGSQNLFHMSTQIVHKLTKITEMAGIEKEKDIVLRKRPFVRFQENEALDFLERELYRYSIDVYEKPQNQISICRGANPGEEIRYVAMGIQKMIQAKQLRYRDIAVVTGDLSGYRNEITRQFGDDGIPYFMDDKKSIMGNPMVELIRGALEIIQKDFSYESVFRYLKTGLVTSDRLMMDRLENYVVALGIRGHKRWSRQWEYEYRGGENLNLEELNRFRQEVLAPLLQLRQAFAQEEVTVKKMTGAVVELLTACQIEEKLEQYRKYFDSLGEYSLAEEYGQAYGLVMELFDRMVSLLGEEQVTKKEYREILDAGFEEIRVGVIPATVDRVVVGDLTRTRLNHIKVLFFVGVNDGIVPLKKDGRSLLTDMEREFLGQHHVELAPTAREDGFMQRFYLYLMMTKPSQKLHLSYSGVSADGKSLRPSTLISEVRKLFPQIEIGDAGERDLMVYSHMDGKLRLIEGLREYDTMRENQEFLELYRWFYERDTDQEEIKQLAKAAFYTYEDKGISKAVAKALYGNVLSGSVTRLEQYAACSYAHFLKFGLDLTERKEYELQAVDVGNLFHNSIDLCFKEIKEQNKSLRDLTEEERRAIVKDCVKQVADQYGNTILQSSARNAFLAARVEKITDRTMWALAKQLDKGDFEPAGFEVSFSAIDNLKAMRISLSEEEELHLRGRIDRLDLCEDEEHIYVKIIDYKSGNSSFDLMALYYGLQLQLVVYMDAVMEIEEKRRPDKKVVPAGIFYYNIKDPLAEKNGDMDAEEIEREIFAQLQMNGLVNSSMDVIEHLDREIETASDIIPVSLKNGEIQEARSSVASERRFMALRSYVREKLADSGREILNGSTHIKPYKQGSKTACDYCPYHAVCGFDQKTEGYEYRRLKKLVKDDIWKEIEGEEELNGDELDR